jgi:hypothetical protein
LLIVPATSAERIARIAQLQQEVEELKAAAKDMEKGRDALVYWEMWSHRRKAVQPVQSQLRN